MQKFSEIVFDVASEGYPLNLWKYVHFFWEYRNPDIKFFWRLVDINNDEVIGTFENEFFKDIFKYFSEACKDFDKLSVIFDNQENNRNSFQITNFISFQTNLD